MNLKEFVALNIHLKRTKDGVTKKFPEVRWVSLSDRETYQPVGERWQFKAPELAAALAEVGQGLLPLMQDENSKLHNGAVSLQEWRDAILRICADCYWAQDFIKNGGLDPKYTGEVAMWLETEESKSQREEVLQLDREYMNDLCALIEENGPEVENINDDLGSLDDRVFALLDRSIDKYSKQFERLLLDEHADYHRIWSNDKFKP